MKLIYGKQGDIATDGKSRFDFKESALMQCNDEVRQFDEKGNEIVMYIEL